MGGIMIVEFKDFVFVMDCPGNFFMSQSTIDAVREVIPNKVIKYVASSHTHGDHAGGARAYFHAGATLITTPIHVEFYKKLAQIKQTIRPDPFASSPKEPVIETFADKRLITDGEQTVVLHNVGPNAHSEELVIAYLPRQKILWQADIFFIPYTGKELNAAMPITIEFSQKLKALGITDFEQIIDAHHSRVATREEFKATLQKAGVEGF
jgi:flavorubredoxin